MESLKRCERAKNVEISEPVQLERDFRMARNLADTEWIVAYLATERACVFRMLGDFDFLHHFT